MRALLPACIGLGGLLGSRGPSPQIRCTQMPVARQPVMLPDTTTKRILMMLEGGRGARATGSCTSGGAKKNGTLLRRHDTAGANQSATCNSTNQNIFTPGWGCAGGKGAPQRKERTWDVLSGATAFAKRRATNTRTIPGSAIACGWSQPRMRVGLEMIQTRSGCTAPPFVHR
jgi:hypothetical protein